MFELMTAIVWVVLLLFGAVMILGLLIIITAEIGVIRRMKVEQLERQQPSLQVGRFQPYEITRRS